MRFVIYKDHSGEWRWSLRTTNGRIIADSSEGYARKATCERIVARIMNGASSALVVDG